MKGDYNPYFDVRPQNLSFVADLQVGENAENTFVEFLQLITTGDVEVKYDRYRNGRMFVETEQCPRGYCTYIQSGINVTRATWWVYFISPSAFIVVAVERLKNYLRANYDELLRCGKKQTGSSDNPARGFLLQPHQVHDLMTMREYDIQNN
jgi:hypothetical protein